MNCWQRELPEESPLNASSTLTTAADAAPLIRQLPLRAWHVAHGARMEPFAGFDMPLHYRLGVLGEHRHTRAAAGLFDVSHMGQIIVRARGSAPREVAGALESLIPVDLEGLPLGRQRYGLLTDETGGIIDDLMIANLGDAWHLVVNAASVERDVAHLVEHLGATCEIELVRDRGLIAIQGPHAAQVLASLVPATRAMRFMDVARLPLAGAEAWISRSGYTGEDGFELSVPISVADAVAARLLDDPAVQLVGLGARDSLRLEAGLCLHGRDIGIHTTPVEAALEWAIAPVRRSGGARAGGFPGADVILPQIVEGTKRRRVGLRPVGRPVRAGARLFADPALDPVGEVTSGTFGPSAGGPVAMGYVPMALAVPGRALIADIRGQRVPATVAPLPFVAHHYHR